MRSSFLAVFFTVALLMTSVGVILSRYHARKLYFSVTQQQEIAHALDVQFGQLQLEETTDSMRFHLQRIAQKKLDLVPPHHTLTVQLRPVGETG